MTNTTAARAYEKARNAYNGLGLDISNAPTFERMSTARQIVGLLLTLEEENEAQVNPTFKKALMILLDALLATPAQMQARVVLYEEVGSNKEEALTFPPAEAMYAIQ
jgi:hypothetical protein